MAQTPRRLPPINAIRVFEAAARIGNYTRAGEELGMTQAAVSYQIKVLEERLGFALFTREGRGVALTAKGRRLSRASSEAFRALEGAFTEVIEQADSILSISALPTFSSNWLVPRIGAFQVAHPELAVRLDTSPDMLDLTAGDVDVGVREGDGKWPGVEAHRLLVEAVAPLVPAQAVERFGPFEQPRDLLRLRLIGPIRWWRAWFEKAGDPGAPLPERPSLELETQQMEVSAAIAAGDAAAVVSTIYFVRELSAGVIVQPFPVEISRAHTVWVAYDKTRARAPKIRAFVDWLLAEAAAARAQASQAPGASLSPSS